jgi:hypothetical protein
MISTLSYPLKLRPQKYHSIDINELIRLLTKKMRRQNSPALMNEQSKRSTLDAVEADHLVKLIERLP